jgi:hypothetical protein
MSSCLATTSSLVLPILKYKIVLEKGKFNRSHAFYNIHMDPNLGIGWVTVCCVACGCGPCKAQLKMPWMPQVDNCAEPCYTENKDCLLWQSYKSKNNLWICQLVPRTGDDERGAQSLMQRVLSKLEVCILLMVREGEVGAIGTMDKKLMGYYVVK